MNKNQGQKLRQLLTKGPVLVAGAYDCLSALLVERAGFKAAYLSGGGLSVGLLGKPDIGLLHREDVVSTARRITASISIPLLVDVDTGYGGPSEVRKTVQMFEAAGAAGIQIEDQAADKRCGHLEGKKIVAAARMIKKIRAACESRRSKDFLIIARTDARGVLGLEESLRRSELYKKAGADIIFPEALQSKGEFSTFGVKKELGTLLANMTEFGRSPSLSVSELAHLGFRLILYPMTAFRVAAQAMEKALSELKSKGQSRSLLHRMQTRRELYNLIHYDIKSSPRKSATADPSFGGLPPE